MAKKGSDANLIAFAAALENKNLVGTTRLL
jgi:hypothetical protein